MIALFAFFWFSALITLLVTRFTSLSVLLLSSMTYSLPVFWAVAQSLDALLIWLIVFSMIIPSQIYLGLLKFPPKPHLGVAGKQEKFINLFFNFSLLIMFLVVVVSSGGINVFFEGKYGAIPGGSLFIYYTWNSLLLVTSAINLFSKKMFSGSNLGCLAQIMLIFIGGDRTIPFLWFCVFVVSRLNGVKMLQLLSARRVGLLFLFTVLAPFFAVSKTIYTLLPSLGFSLELLFEVFGPNFWRLASQNFEPNHAHNILIYATSGVVDYSISDLALGVLSFVPGSSLFGIEPHAFSLAVKSQYFSTWSDQAGIGAHFWAQAWVVGGFLGVVIFAAGVICFLAFCDRLLSTSAFSHVRAFAAVQVAFFGFYIQRNSMEQILSFSGRYLAIFFLLLFGSYVVRRLLTGGQRAK